jgi:hypothetical protein
MLALLEAKKWARDLHDIREGKQIGSVSKA